MKILFDHQCFTIQNYGGISRYFTGLFEEFSKDSNINISLALKYSNNFYLKDKKYFNGKSFLAGQNFKGHKFLIHLMNMVKSSNQIKNENYDLLHPTYYNPYFLNKLGTKPFVITVFDMIHEIFPDSIHWLDKTAAQKKYLLPKANKIIAISNHTKADLVERLNVHPDKVEVIYLATHITKEISLSNDDLKLPDRYILYVGSRNYYKNFNNFLKAFKEISKNDNVISLVCAGGGKFTQAEKELFNNYNLTNQILHKNADDISLATLYSNALMFVFPSFYEGFGIPVLEAMNCDCPMALSNVSSLPEIGADAAIYFDPKEIKDISLKMTTVIYDNTLRKKLIQNGVSRRKDFSWEKTAMETKRLYEKSI